VEGTTVSVINTSTDKVTKTIEGFENPWGFTKISNSKMVVSNYGGQITVIDFQNDALVDEKTFSTKFGGITSSTDGSTLFVVAIPEKKVYKLDATTLDSLDSYDTGNDPDGVELSSNDSLLIVTNTSDGTISIINVNNKSTSMLSPGGKPELIHANRNGSKIYVSNFTLNKVHVLNGLTGQLEKDIEGFDGPEEAVESPDGKYLYVVNFNSSSVDCFEVFDYKKLDESHKTGLKPIGIMPLSNNKKAYVSNYGDNNITIIKF
jgi:DNA-binding beta-propeller fold protein YncE